MMRGFKINSGIRYTRVIITNIAAWLTGLVIAGFYGKSRRKVSSVKFDGLDSHIYQNIFTLSVCLHNSFAFNSA